MQRALRKCHFPSLPLVIHSGLAVDASALEPRTLVDNMPSCPDVGAHGNESVIEEVLPEPPLNRLAAIAERNSHHYSPLPSGDAIRVIELQPGDREEPIAFGLEVVPAYRSAEGYCALSYCWGDAADTVEVSCDGTPFSITRNLHGALKQLRHTNTARRLWIDAVCIHQHDIAERNQQVSIMRQIYTKAQRVDVWLGPGDAGTAEAVALIDAIATKCCVSIYGPGNRAWWVERLRAEEDPPAVVPRNFTMSDLPNASSSSWQSMWRYYDQAWFTRVWVIQEAQACSDVRVICGSFTIGWEFVALVSAWLLFSRDQDIRLMFFNSQGYKNAQTIRQRLIARREVPFLVVLHRARGFCSTDPRDKVFSLLQHAITFPSDGTDSWRHGRLSEVEEIRNADTHLGMQADYNMTTLEVYHEVAVRSIRQSGSLEILSYASPESARMSGQPSWIPRWDVDQNHLRNFTPPRHFAASASKKAVLSHVSIKNIALRGIRLDQIQNSRAILPIGGRTVIDSSPLIQTCSRLGADWLMSLSRILTQDTWTGRSNSATGRRRAKDILSTHFSDFSSYIVDAVGDNPQTQGCYLALDQQTCDVCSQTFVNWGTPYTEPPQSYKCSICARGDFDLCPSCHRSGKRCWVPAHDLQLTTLTAIQYVHDDAMLARHRTEAASGVSRSFRDVARSACYGKLFFATATGWIGVGARGLQAGDIVAVLFGCRVPVILRRRQHFFELVGSCYVHGIMDGEAIEMCENGQLTHEDFELH